VCTLSFLRSSTLELRNQPRACFPTSFLESLLARFAIFPTPADGRRRCRSSLLFLSLSASRVPPGLSYVASIVVPFFHEKLAPDKRSTGKIEPPANRECSPFRFFSIQGSPARITLQLSRFVLFLSLSLSL